MKVPCSGNFTGTHTLIGGNFRMFLLKKKFPLTIYLSKYTSSLQLRIFQVFLRLTIKDSQSETQEFNVFIYYVVGIWCSVFAMLSYS